MFAAHFGLSNLVVIVDANAYQAMGSTAEVMHLGSVAEKLCAFGLVTREVDGHDQVALDTAIQDLLRDASPRPKGIVAHTVKGKGISFMEANNCWHYTRLDPGSYQAALAELDL